MTYNLGAVGFGHWFNRLYAGLRESNEFRIAKVVGVSDVSKKMEKLREIGLEEKDYYRVSDGKLPENFYSGLDLVHISDPNEYHAQQTIDSLKHGKFTVTEKTWCMHAEQRAIMDALKRNPEELPGSRIYFIRLAEDGSTDIFA